MKFVILCKQAGEGCDYTIGCGYIYRFFDAKDMDDALYQIRTMDKDEYSDNQQRVFGHQASDLVQAIILPAEATVDALHTKSRREIAEEQDQARIAEVKAEQARFESARQQESKDRAEYERLKQKFG